MKILFVLEYYYPNIGGVEKLFKNLTENLVKDNHEVMVLTNRFNKKLKKKEIINGVKIRRLGFYNRYFFTFFSLPWVIFYARKFDLIHTTSYNAALPAFLASKILKKKSIITFHEAWGKLWFKLPFISSFSKFLFYSYEQFILKFSFDKFIAVSDFTKVRLIEEGVDQNKIIRIYNGIEYKNTEKEQLNPPEIFTYTFFGRLGPSKGIDILLKAAKKFHSKFPETKLKLIIPKTPKPFFNKVKTIISDYKLSKHVQLMHHLNKKQLKTELLNSSCVVIPSYSEGFCFAAAETVALKVPVIHSGKGALPEVVGGKSLLMNDFSSQGLANALGIAKQGKWDKKQIKEFRLNDTINNYLAVFDELMSS